VPAQLPADTAAFTGRTRQLDQLLAPPPGSTAAASNTVVISAIGGMAGIGKTALAVHAAHRLAAAYPDGQLFVDLHGYTRGVEPTDPLAALESMLRALGVAGAQIPPSLDERAALYRTRVAGTRTLVVLDNAQSETQVRPLLPAGPGCLVIITSRQNLTGLDDARQLSLDVLPAADATTMFTRAAGPGRLSGEPATLIIEVVELCGRLPLAIRIAAARLRSRPAWTLAHLVERLRDHRYRLAELDAGQRSVTAALDLSYRHLDPAARRLYRLLGQHPGSHIDAPAAAALAGVTADQGRPLLDRLVDAHLLAEPAPGRYRFHDLVRAHAAAMATGTDADAARRAALGRLLDHYAHTASVAMDLVYPHETDHRPPAPRDRTAPRTFDRPQQAEAWLDTELDNLLAAASHAADHGWPEHTLHQSATLHRHLHTRAHHRHAEILHTRALTAARATGNRTGEQNGLAGLGDVHRMQGRYQQATDSYRQALEIARATGDRTGRQTALTGLGQAHYLAGRPEQAVECFGQALEIARATGNRTGLSEALAGLGHVHRWEDRYEQAVECYRQALEIARATGNRTAEQNALTGLGLTQHRQGRYEQAADCFRQVLGIARATGNRTGEQYALYGLGLTQQRQGRDQQAAGSYRQALEIARATGNRNVEQYALYGLGQILRVQGRHEQAIGVYRDALAVADDIGDRDSQFEAHDGLGRAYQAAGRHQDALRWHRAALEVAGNPGSQARAHEGLGRAHRALARPDLARHHWRQAQAVLNAAGLDASSDPQVTIAALRQLVEADPQQHERTPEAAPRAG
jgi:tetratricopeptide (TPR) repeat protein